MAKSVINEFASIYPQITEALQQYVIKIIEEKIEWKARQNYQEIYDFFYSELGITTTTQQPDNAHSISWSLAFLIFSLSIVIFAV